MKLDIRRQGITVDENAAAYIERRLLFALGRFGPRVGRVGVYLADLNGPKGGPGQALPARRPPAARRRGHRRGAGREVVRPD